MPTRVKAQLVDGNMQLKILIDHPMHTGRQHDPVSGAEIPAHYIVRLTVSHNGRPVIDAQLSTAVSRNPHLTFELRGGAVGDSVQVAWQDNLGLTEHQETRVKGAAVH